MAIGSALVAIGGFIAAASPYILGAAAIGGAATSITMGGISAAQQTQMAEHNAKLQEEQAENAKLLAEREAMAHEEDTREQVRLEREHNEKLKAKIRNEGGVSGLVQTAGTPLLMQIKNAEAMEFNAQQAWRTGQIQAENIRTTGQMNAYNLNNSAASTRVQGKNAAFNSWSSGIAGGLNSAASGASMGMNYMYKKNKFV